MLFIGSYSCTRHNAPKRLELQKQGKVSFLCLKNIDWITSEYMQQIEDAAREIISAHNPKEFILFGGCQLEILNVDFDSIVANLSAEFQVSVSFQKGCSLIDNSMWKRRGFDEKFVVFHSAAPCR